MVSMSVEQFEALVTDALDGIPPELGNNMENVAVVVDELSPPGSLLGLYEGIPLTNRGNSYMSAVPDRITIYMATICSACRDHPGSGGHGAQNGDPRDRSSLRYR